MRDGFLTDDEAKRIIMALYDRGYGIAVYILERILGTRLALEVREDLIHEAFLKLLLHVEQLHQRTPQEQMAYLARTVRTVALDEARRRTQMQMLDSLDSPDCPEPKAEDLSPEEFCMMQEDIAEKTANMKAVMERLPERDRRLLIEKYQNGCSDAEIGKMLGIKTRNVRVYLARARHKAAIYYGEEVDGKRKQEHRTDDTGSKERIDQEEKSEGS